MAPQKEILFWSTTQIKQVQGLVLASSQRQKDTFPLDCQTFSFPKGTNSKEKRGLHAGHTYYGYSIAMTKFDLRKKLPTTIPRQILILFTPCNPIEVNRISLMSLRDEFGLKYAKISLFCRSAYAQDPLKVIFTWSTCYFI